MNRLRLLAYCLPLSLALALPAQAAPTNEELRLAGECSAIGVVVTRYPAGFPSSWQQLAMPLLKSPALLNGGPDLAFKDDPVYLKAANAVLDAWRTMGNAGDFGKAYADKTNACASWVGGLIQRAPQR